MLRNCVKSIRKFLLSPKDYFGVKKFISYMNSTAKSLGMVNSFFDTPSGASFTSFSTAHDLYLLSEVFYSNETFRLMCSTQFIDIGNRHIRNNALIDALSVFDFPVSVKTGTWADTNKAICLHSQYGCLCIMSNNPVVFNNINNIANQILHDTYHADTQIGYFGIFNGVSYHHNENKRFIPASTTKLLTALCAYNICKLEGSITIKRCDISSGSGSNYNVGETFQIIDAVKIMLMESSNTLANAIARTCGFMI